jgi:hypothetical protein
LEKNHSFGTQSAFQLLNMNEKEKHLAQLADIRTMMERSSRFISLSGLSGIWAGCCALLGAGVVYFYWDLASIIRLSLAGRAFGSGDKVADYRMSLVVIGIVVLVAAILGGLFFTRRKAQARGQKVWDHTTRRLLWALAVPLVAGGLFCLGLLYWNLIALVAPATLLFYGLALINGSNHTFGDIYYLGITEIILGLIGTFFVGYGLELWAIGFGLMHIVYGTVMYYRYDRERT